MLVNLYGGPGVGKSTASAYVFALLKMSGIEAEQVGEAAKDLVYDECFALMGNQVLMAGLQWQRLRRLAKAGTEVLVSDSAQLMGTMYGEGLPYHDELEVLLRKLDTLVNPVYRVFIHRKQAYVRLGRVQETEADARVFDEKAYELGKPFWLEVEQTRQGFDHLADMVSQEVLKQRELTKSPDFGIL